MSCGCGLLLIIIVVAVVIVVTAVVVSATDVVPGHCEFTGTEIREMLEETFGHVQGTEGATGTLVLNCRHGSLALVGDQELFAALNGRVDTGIELVTIECDDVIAWSVVVTACAKTNVVPGSTPSETLLVEMSGRAVVGLLYEAMLMGSGGDEGERGEDDREGRKSEDHFVFGFLAVMDSKKNVGRENRLVQKTIVEKECRSLWAKECVASEPSG